MILSKKTSKTDGLNKLMPKRVLKNILIACLAATGSIAIIGCSETQQEQAKQTLGLDQRDVFTLKVGSCFNDTQNPEAGDDEYNLIDEVPMRDCGKPHDNEVFYVFDLPDGPTVPNGETIEEIVNTACDKAYEAYVGIAYEDSLYYSNYMSPSDESWTQLDDREIVCYAYDEKQLSASIKATAI